MQSLSFGIVWFGVGVAVLAAGCNGSTSATQAPAPVASGGVGNTTTTAAGVGGGSAQNLGGSMTGGSNTVSNPIGGGTAVGGSSNIGGSTSVGTGGIPMRGGAGGTVATGGSATGGSATGGVWRGPTPATATAKFPFPQNRFSPNCTYPTDFKNEDVQAVFTKWKSDLVVSDNAGALRVKRPAEPGLAVNSTVSEGIAYGMIIAVYMNDQTLFDGLWKFALKYPTKALVGTSEVQTMLMNWYVEPDLTLVTAQEDPTNSANYYGAATDADEDMAWALIMADRQWGGQGTLAKSYLQSAKDLLNDIWNYEILDGKLPKNGNRWGNWDSLNISYFAPAYYRVFAQVTVKAEWNTGVVKCVYDTIGTNLTSAYGNLNNGLVRAFSTTTGGTAQYQKDWYNYDSCRTPFRIGLDACLVNANSDYKDQAKSYVAKTSQFFAGIGAANIVDGYQINGTAKPEFGTSRGFQGRSAAFIGPAGVGAMHSSSYQSFVNDVWGLIRQNNMWCGGQYYDESWTLLTLLMMSGNFLDYTAETPK